MLDMQTGLCRSINLTKKKKPLQNYCMECSGLGCKKGAMSMYIPLPTRITVISTFWIEMLECAKIFPP